MRGGDLHMIYERADSLEKVSDGARLVLACVGGRKFVTGQEADDLDTPPGRTDDGTEGPGVGGGNARPIQD